jgi:hypothetical protein
VGCLATKKRDRFASFQSSGNVQRPNWEVWSVLTSLKLLATPKLTWHCPHQRCSLVLARLSILTLRATHNFFRWANSHVGCWQELVLRIWNQTNVKCLHYRLITFAIRPDEIGFPGLGRLFYAHKTTDPGGDSYRKHLISSSIPRNSLGVSRRGLLHGMLLPRPAAQKKLHSSTTEFCRLIANLPTN